MLGELLFNLQRLPGFESRLPTWRDGDLESSIAELQAAMYLESSGISCGFVSPVGKRQSDYDIDAQIGELSVAVEAKAKIEAGSWSANSIVTTLKNARPQLPSDRPGIVFLKIPEEWAQPGRHEAIAVAVQEGCASTGRIAATVVHWERWGDNSQGAIRAECFRIIENPKSRIPIPNLMSLVKDGPAMMTSWMPMEQVVCGLGDAIKPILVDMSIRVRQAMTTKQLPAFVRMAYGGSLANLRSMDESSLVTVVKFRCDTFDVVGSSAGGAHVSLDAGLIRAFTVFRLGQVLDRFQIEIEGKVYDWLLNEVDGVLSHPTPRIDLDRTSKRIGGDRFVTSLRHLFCRLVKEGVLQQGPHELKNLIVQYVDKRDDSTVFAVSYGHDVTL